jgi:hypothetical protein
MAKPKRIYQDCLADAVAAKKITAKAAKLLTKHFEDAEKEAIQNGASEVAAYAFAATKGAERMMEQVGLSRANAARSIMKIETNWQNANAHKQGLWIRFYTLDGYDPAEDSGDGSASATADLRGDRDFVAIEWRTERDVLRVDRFAVDDELLNVFETRLTE